MLAVLKPDAGGARITSWFGYAYWGGRGVVFTVGRPSIVMGMSA
jgi:hypothetical protein